MAGEGEDPGAAEAPVWPRPILRWPDPRLKARAEPVARVDDGVRAVWAEMAAAMRAFRGVGLAAPQLGIGLRLALVDPTATGLRPLRLANPELLWTSPDTETRQEASPCLPGVAEEVRRPASVRVGFLGEEGPEERLLTGLAARSLQHQIDHLDGRLYLDRLGEMRRKRLLERYRKLARGGGRRP